MELDNNILVIGLILFIGVIYLIIQLVSFPNKSENKTCGIVAFVLSILSFFLGGFGIIFALIGIVCGVNSKNTFGKIGAILSILYLLYMFLVMVGLFSLTGQF
jgi:type IV secretory pathway VirB2 component (pilin)